MDLKENGKKACIINFDNGSKECVPESTKEDCAAICAKTPNAKCELSSEPECPRGK